MSAHTPGPWFAERHGIATADVDGHRRQVASTTGDAVMHGDPSVSVVEIQMANARLIAAAPDLLSALEAAERSLAVAVRHACDMPDFDPGEHVVIKAARSAIAKARGGK